MSLLIHWALQFLLTCQLSNSIIQKPLQQMKEKIYISCSCYLCLISAFQVGIHVCSSLHYKLVTDSLATAVLQETITQSCLSSVQCWYCSLITPNQPIKNFVDTLSKSADKTQQEHEKADPTGE